MTVGNWPIGAFDNVATAPPPIGNSLKYNIIPTTSQGMILQDKFIN